MSEHPGFDPADETFDAVPLIEALAEAGVEFVVVGGVAGRSHGSPMVTYDVDVCYRRIEANYRPLVVALRELGAKLRGTDDDVPFRLDAETIAKGGSFTFVTDHGSLDILAIPSGTSGYDQLRTNAVRMTIGGNQVWVAALDDLIAMKEAADRPKDKLHLMHLLAIKEVLAEGG